MASRHAGLYGDDTRVSRVRSVVSSVWHHVTRVCMRMTIMSRALGQSCLDFCVMICFILISSSVFSIEPYLIYLVSFRPELSPVYFVYLVSFSPEVSEHGV